MALWAGMGVSPSISVMSQNSPPSFFMKASRSCSRELSTEQYLHERYELFNFFFFHDYNNFDAPIPGNRIFINQWIIAIKYTCMYMLVNFLYETYWWLLHCGSQPLDVRVGVGWVCDEWFQPSGVCPNFQTLCCSQYQNNYSLSQ